MPVDNNCDCELCFVGGLRNDVILNSRNGSFQRRDLFHSYEGCVFELSLLHDPTGISLARVHNNVSKHHSRISISWWPGPQRKTNPCDKTEPVKDTHHCNTSLLCIILGFPANLDTLKRWAVCVKKWWYGWLTLQCFVSTELKNEAGVCPGVESFVDPNLLK